MAQAAVLEGAPPGGDILAVGKRFNKGQPVRPFLRHEQTGSPSGKTVDRQGKERAIAEKSSGIPRELRKDFTDSAMGDFARLLELYNGTPEQRASYFRMINEPAYEPYKVLMQRFAKPKLGAAREGSPMLVLDEAAMRSHFEDTKDGFTDAYRLRVIKLEEMVLNECVKLSFNLPPPQPGTIEDQDINTGRGGAGREGARSLRLLLGRRRETYGREVGGMNARYGDVATTLTLLSTAFGLGGNLLLPGIGTLAAGIPPVVAGLLHTFRRGERVTMRQVREALNTMQRVPPARREWAREMYNIDVTNRENGRRGGIRVRERISDGRHIALPEIRKTTSRDILAEERRKIEQAQGAMGVPRELRQAVDNWFSEPNGRFGLEERQFLQRNIPWEVEAQREFLRQLVDGNGNPYLTQVSPGEWRVNDAFNLNTLEGTADQQRNTYLLIRRRCFARDLRTRFRQVDELANDREATLDKLIARRVAEHGEEGAITKERTAPVDATIRRFTEDRDRLDRELTPLNEINTALQAVTEARAAQERLRRTVTIVTVPGGTPAGAEAALQATLTDTTSTLPPPPPPPAVAIPGPPYGATITVRYEGKSYRIDSIEARIQAEEIRHQEGLRVIGTSGLSRVAEQNAIDKAEEAHNRRLEAIGRDRSVIEAVQESLIQAQTAIETSQAAVSERAGAQREAIQTFGTAVSEARNEIINIIPIPPFGATPAYLAPVVAVINAEIAAGTLPPDFLDFRGSLQTAEFDVLMERVNYIRDIAVGRSIVPPAGTPLPGWPEGENNQEARRMLMYHAMVEARAARVQPRILGATPEFGQALDDTIRPLGTPSGWGVREVDMLVSTTAQLQAIFTQRAADIGAAGRTAFAVPGLPEIEALQEQALLRFRARQQAAQTLRGAVDGRVTTEQGNRERIVEETANNAELAFIQEARARMSELSDRLLAMTEEQLSRALDPTPLAPNARFPYETGWPGGYIWLLNEIGGHRESDVEYQNMNGHEGAFNRNMTFLPPELVRNLLTQYFNLRIPTGGGGFRLPYTFAEAITLVRNSLNVNPPIITTFDFNRFVLDFVIMENLGQRVATV